MKCPKCDDLMKLKQSKYGVYWESDCGQKLNLDINLIPSKEDIEVFKQERISQDLAVLRGQCLNIAGELVAAHMQKYLNTASVDELNGNPQNFWANKVWLQFEELFTVMKKKGFLEVK